MNRPFNFDNAGNQGIVNGNAMTYDAESRLIAVTESLSMGSKFTSYLYDGDGRRVEKFDSSGNHTFYAYDAQGQLAAEYGTAGGPAPCTTCYLNWDQVGSTRLVTDQAGQVVARHDYLPFGEELGTNVAGRGSDGSSQDDTIRQKFTGKERDSESGLGRVRETDVFEGLAHRAPQTKASFAYFATKPAGKIPCIAGPRTIIESYQLSRPARN